MYTRFVSFVLFDDEIRLCLKFVILVFVTGAEGRAHDDLNLNE